MSTVNGEGGLREAVLRDALIDRLRRDGHLRSPRVEAAFRSVLRHRFVPEVPDGYLPLDEAAKRFGCARQTILHKVQRGELDAVQVVNGRRKGLRIKVTGPDAGLFEK